MYETNAHFIKRLIDEHFDEDLRITIEQQIAASKSYNQQLEQVRDASANVLTALESLSATIHAHCERHA